MAKTLNLAEIFKADAEELWQARERAAQIHRTNDIRAAGDEVEQAVRDYLCRMLPSRYYVTSGHLIDSGHLVSPQLDVIIADHFSLPSLLTTRDGTKYIPITSVYAIGDVQSISFSLSIIGATHGTIVAVRAKDRSEIEAVQSAFENAPSEDRISLGESEPKPVVFIGHGRSLLWRELKDHLQDMHGYSVEAYEVGARAGHSIRDILDSMLDNSSFAFLVMTAEDEMSDGTYQPRMNVVHELGLFQGRLGWPRGIMLLEKGAEDFSNMAGIHQLRFSQGNIKEIFGDVLATLRENSHHSIHYHPHRTDVEQAAPADLPNPCCTNLISLLI